jgi:hypothetical protein
MSLGTGTTGKTILVPLDPDLPAKANANEFPLESVPSSRQPFRLGATGPELDTGKGLGRARGTTKVFQISGQRQIEGSSSGGAIRLSGRVAESSNAFGYLVKHGVKPIGGVSGCRGRDSTNKADIHVYRINPRRVENNAIWCFGRVRRRPSQAGHTQDAEKCRRKCRFSDTAERHEGQCAQRGARANDVQLFPGKGRQSAFEIVLTHNLSKYLWVLDPSFDLGVHDARAPLPHSLGIVARFTSRA